MLEQVNNTAPKVLVAILDRDKVKKATAILNEHKVHFTFVCLGQGTATSEMLGLFGLGETDKALLICMDCKFRMPILMHALSQRLHLERPGVGIAFVMPVSGIHGSVFQLLNHDIQEKLEAKVESEATKMQCEVKNDLIVAIINRGFSEDLMAAARTAGAGGGTVIQARRVGHEESARFFGISIQAEKEIVAILAPREKKGELMKVISSAAGIQTEAKGIVLSIPVESVEGIQLLKKKPEGDKE